MIWFQLGMLWDAGPEITHGLGAFLYAAGTNPLLARVAALAHLVAFAVEEPKHHGVRFIVGLTLAIEDLIALHAVFPLMVRPLYLRQTVDSLRTEHEILETCTDTLLLCRYADVLGVPDRTGHSYDRVTSI